VKVRNRGVVLYTLVPVGDKENLSEASVAVQWRPARRNTPPKDVCGEIVQIFKVVPCRLQVRITAVQNTVRLG